jgi:hypothetical protein
VGNLASHAASQPVIAGSRGVVKEVLRVAKEASGPELLDVAAGGRAGSIRTMCTLWSLVAVGV